MNTDLKTASDAACRENYDNRYHKIKADLDYDAYQRIWNDAVQFGFSQHNNAAKLFAGIVAHDNKPQFVFDPNGPDYLHCLCCAAEIENNDGKAKIEQLEHAPDCLYIQAVNYSKD